MTPSGKRANYDKRRFFVPTVGMRVDGSVDETHVRQMQSPLLPSPRMQSPLMQSPLMQYPRMQSPLMQSPWMQSPRM